LYYVKIGENVTSIGDNAFSECTSLLNITIPKNVISIGDRIFSGCTSLESIDVDEDNTNFKSSNGILFNSDFTTLVLFPPGNKDASGNKSTSYTIPNTVKSIEHHAFYNCADLVNITIPDKLQTIGDYAFSHCSSLTNITIPNSVKSIGNHTFEECRNLKNVTIGNGITSIGDSVFYDCYALQSVTIPNTVESIGNYAFLHCHNMKISKIPDGVKSIGNSAFSYCYGITSLNLGYVETIGNCAFQSCSSLTTIDIPASVKSIGDGPFYYCSKLETITVNKDNTNFKSVDGVLFDYSCTKLIQYPIGNKATSYTIPNSVKTIGYYAFYYCSYLSNAIIPDSITSIGNYSFFYCSKLKNMTIPNSVKSIGNYAFNHCSNISNLVIGSNVESIGSYAFSYCSNLTNVVIPDSVTFIGSYAFYYCSNLTSVIIPDSLKSIEYYTFYNCSKLKNVTIPDSVTYIGSSAFYNCADLNTVVFQGSRVSCSSSFVKKPETICVPPDYTSPSFCGAPVTSNADLCQKFRSKFNKCYKASTYIDGDFKQEKKRSVIEWESRSTGCEWYGCSNDTGNINFNTCNSTETVARMCVKDECKEWLWSVVLDINGFNLTDLDISEIEDEIARITNTSTKKFTYYLIYDENGNLVSIVIFVEDKETADIMAAAINEHLEECKPEDKTAEPYSMNVIQTRRGEGNSIKNSKPPDNNMMIDQKKNNKFYWY